MRVRWTTDAADDLERICDYFAESRPASARRVAQSVVERISELQEFPRIGRPGRVVGTREITFPPLPYVAVYEILEPQDEVRVLRVLHGAQQWPRGRGEDATTSPGQPKSPLAIDQDLDRT